MPQALSSSEKEAQDTSLEAALPSEDHGATANIVDWDGPNDAANPINWPSRKRWSHIIIVAILGLIP